MNNSKIRILALLLSLIMLVGILASCTPGDENTTDAESEVTVEQTSDTDVESKSETDMATETESESETDVEETETETDAPHLEGENAELIETADKLKNGVNAYYNNELTNYFFENQNVSVLCDLQDTKVISKVADKNGNAYVEDTMDVFLRMTDGSTYFASESGNNAIANINRLGYYYYENSIEGLTFTKGYEFEDDGRQLRHYNILRYNMTELVEMDSDKNVKIKVTNSEDPWISFDGINFSAEQYNILSLTMKVDKSFATSFTIYLISGERSGSKNFSSEQSMSFDIIPDGEFHTYYIPLYYINDYTGKVTGLRFDFWAASGAKNGVFEISEMRVLNAPVEDSPEGVYVNRTFNTYSDKLHQTLQIATKNTIADVEAVGILTEISADKVASVIVKDANGLHYDLENIDWASAEYVGFDIKNVGVFGYILPYDGEGGSIKVTLEDEIYKIEQTKTPENNTLIPSAKGTKNANDFYMGHRIYNDSNHSFDAFIAEAELERNPLGADNFVIDAEKSTYGEFIGYDSLRGCYTLAIDGSGGFGPPYKLHKNRQYNVTFTLKGDGVNDRSIYVLALYDQGGSLECAALLDGKQMMLPVPLEVGKNFADEGSGIFNLDDARYSETILPMVASADTELTYSIVNMYYNWGKYPLKQISFIQYYAPYYHLSTGVHESNCITPYYFPNTSSILQVLPDHRPMSGPVWEGDPQRTYCGVHEFLQYTDAEGNYYTSNNVKDTIGSYGPTYCDVTMDYVSDDGKIKISYNHMEMPQTDENRTYYQMKYEILEDISFKDFGSDFSFYSVASLDPQGLYQKVGYLDVNNESQVAAAAISGESFEYVLGDECPYFSFFDMDEAIFKHGYSNLSFLIYNSEFVIGGESVTPSFLVRNTPGKLWLSLDLEEVTLKAGDTFTINAILMPWQSYEVYDETAPDKNVRDVRENTLLDPIKLEATRYCEVIDTVYLPSIRTTNGKVAEFAISGGQNNTTIRVYGFDKLTVPVIEENAGDGWVEVDLSSISTPDASGYGYQYDGYAVHYDGDGTYSYSFVTNMKDGEKKEFRVRAITDFEGWPEIVKSPDPMNLWFDPQRINAELVKAANRFGEISMMSEEGVDFVRVHRNGTDNEATFILCEDKEGISAGRYLVFKMRIPQGSAAKLNTWQFYTSTEHTVYDADGNILIVGEDYNATCPHLADGKWHVIVMDLEAYGKSESFKADENGNYKIQYLRFDAFNIGNAVDAYFDIAYIGLHNSLDTILQYNSDLNTVAYFENASYYEHVTTKNYEPLNLHIDATELNEIIYRYSSRFHSVTLSENKDYIRLAGATGAEATIEVLVNNHKETGAYMVLKYRIPEENPGNLAYWNFYTDTSVNKASGDNSYTSEGLGTVVIADGNWQVVIFDLAARGLETFAAVDGKYTAKYLRFDFFNKQYDESVYYDVEYIGFSDSIDDIIAISSDVETVTVSTSQQEYYFINTATGEKVQQ